jgi:SNF2 family DNA or RNA helicase
MPDVLLMSYGLVVNEVEKENSIFNDLTFDRLVLDECHYSKNQNTATFKALIRINVGKRWLLSGTPIVNNVKEMYTLLKLLNYIDTKKVLKDYNNGGGGGYINQNRVLHHSRFYTNIQNILKEISIRRTKEILDLPDKIINQVQVNLSTLEMEFYRNFVCYSKKRLKLLVKNLNKINYSTHVHFRIRSSLRLLIMRCLLGVIYNCRILCCDVLLVQKNMPIIKNKNIKESIKVLETANFTKDCCQVCLNDEETYEFIQCGHKMCQVCMNGLTRLEFCFFCMRETDGKTRRICESSVLSRQNHFTQTVNMSSKTRKILDILDVNLKENRKTVIVSQWTSYLDIIISKFQMHYPNVEFVQLTGKTIPKKRQLLVDEFQNKDNIKVAFASLTSSSEGINLTAANEIILCDLYWNKAKMDQMTDRIYRVGQEKIVNVHNLIVKDTIEEKIKDLIDKKDVICKVIVDGMKVTQSVENWLSRIINLI